MAGKGDKQRPTDLKKFVKNFDAIKWGTHSPSHTKKADGNCPFPSTVARKLKYKGCLICGGKL